VTFVCVVGGNGERADYQLIENGNAAVVRTRVGYDDTTFHTYHMFCGVDVMAIGGLEYYFNLVKLDTNGDEVATFWSGKEVARFVTENDRKAILAVVLTATHMLVERVRPYEVFMVTHDPNPPEKAMLKYSLIIQAFHECGYVAKATDPYQGLQSWWITRRDEIDGRTRSSEIFVQ
jgi:hypothetical protein